MASFFLSFWLGTLPLFSILLHSLEMLRKPAASKNKLTEAGKSGVQLWEYHFSPLPHPTSPRSRDNGAVTGLAKYAPYLSA